MYRFELIEAPEQEPVSLSEAKQFCRYYDIDEDGLILGFIETARRLVESWTQRALVTSTWKLYLDRFPAGGIQIRKIPVASIESVAYYDAGGTLTTWDEADYQSDLVSTPPVLWPVSGISYPSTEYGKLNPVAIEFIAGQAVEDVDRRAKHAILFLVKHWFENRDMVAMGSTPSEIPTTAQALIDSLKWTAYAGAC